jgi:CheY-like chemotaxis protein
MPYKTHIGENGVQGLELMGHERPEVVFADTSMPGLCGLRRVDEPKALAHVKHVPNIVATASV